MWDRVLRAGGMGQDSVKEKERNKEDTKVLEYPIVITTVGAFIESPSLVRRRAQWCDYLGDDERYIDVGKYVIQCLRYTPYYT